MGLSETLGKPPSARELAPLLGFSYQTILIQIKEILRHRALSTTERYLRRLGDLREAMEVLGRKEGG